jgi:hypothetical protein
VSLYALDSRSHVKDHIPAGKSLRITLGAGVLVLYRVAVVLICFAIDYKYGGGASQYGGD